MKRLFSAVTAVVMLLSVLCGCGGDSLAGKGFRFPLSAEPRQLDPQAAADTASVNVLAAVFEGLTSLDENGEAVPGAAEWTVSADGLVYTFTLRASNWRYYTKDKDDPYNGAPVTARDFRFAILRAANPATKSSLAHLTYGIAGARNFSEGRSGADAVGVKAAGDNKLIITLTAPDKDFPVLLASAPFYPCHEPFFNYTSGQYGLEAEYILTNGPFFVRSWAHGQSLLLNKNEKYHRGADILPSAVRYMIDSDGDPVDTILSGNLDAAWIQGGLVRKARDNGLTLFMQEDEVQLLLFNTKKDVLGNTKVRLALRSALEQDAITAQHDGNRSSPAFGFVPPDAVLDGGEPYRTEENRLSPEEDAVTAPAAMLAEGLAQAGADELGKLTLLCPDDEYSLKFARYIIQSWQKNLSFYFKIETLPEASLKTRVESGSYQLALYSVTASGRSALDALSYFAKSNPSGWTDKAYAGAVAKADRGNRKKLETLEKTLWNACPAVPVAFPRRYAAVNPDASGIIVRPFGGGRHGAPFDFRYAGKKD